MNIQNVQTGKYIEPRQDPTPAKTLEPAGDSQHLKVTGDDQQKSFQFHSETDPFVKIVGDTMRFENLLKMSQCRTTVTLKQRHSGGSGDVAAGPEVPRERCEAGNWHS